MPKTIIKAQLRDMITIDVMKKVSVSLDFEIRKHWPKRKPIIFDEIQELKVKTCPRNIYLTHSLQV